MALAAPGATPLVFRLQEGTPEVVREVLLERGWVEYNKQEQEEGDWNLYWRTSAFRHAEYENILPWQRLNHHPKTSGLTRKDSLARNLKRMRGTFGSALYDFSPTAFILPNDYTRFLAEYTKDQPENGGTPGYWICKPVDLSRGRGIFVFKAIKDLTYDSPVIVQRYISNPLLVSGYKFDLRIYVCVRSFHPLTVYMYQEGLVRFATEKYKLTSLDNPFAHLTNTSINKFGPSYTTDKERVGPGCKWTMSKFRCFLHSQDIDELLLWQRITSIVTLTLLTVAPSVPPSPNCMELFGFDVLIDNNYKPWLLEVNCSPALSLDCPADVTVKKGLLHDLFDLLNYKKIDSLRQSGYLRQRYRGFLGPESLESTIPPVLLLPKSMCQPISQHQSFSQGNLQSYSSASEDCSHAKEHSRSIAVQLSTAARRSRSDSARCSKYIPNSKASISCESNSKYPPLSKIPKGIQLAASQATLESGSQLSLKQKKLPLKQSSLGLGKLPPIHIQRYKPPSFPWEQTPQNSPRPPSRVGDFILTFPFNDVTFKASQSKVNVRVAVHEVHRLIHRLASSDNQKGKARREARVEVCDGKECFGSLLWGPRYPPLLSECCSPP
ncbi:putative tubulin polyglutamylase TTLL2 [Amia ocellicauda]|uniref:putative tubulin polyglutamylase TTLL2 n=1 Tax=Amia ocellicauda TaxID=2972642 RepID=UPI003463F180